MKNPAVIGIAVVIIVVAGIGISYFSYVDQNGGITPGHYDELAQCIKDKGVTFFGAFWCPHCQAQKKAFGTSEKLLPYEECSTPDGQGQLQVCKDAGVTTYPTWKFADGTTVTGEQTPADLAAKTGCSLPEGEVPSITMPATEGASSQAN